MKKITLLALLAVAALIVTPKPAYAGNKGLAILGGVIGGLIIADALDDDDDYHHTTVHVTHRDGYWRDVPYDVWVEGRWIITDRYDCPTRRYIPGHYETRVRKVWVSDYSSEYRYSHRDRRHRNRRYDSRHHRHHDRCDHH